MAKVKELMVSERELIQRLSLITGYGKDIVRDVIKSQTEFVIDELSNGIPVRLGGLGEFSTYKAKCMGGYHFGRKEMMPAKEVTRIKFAISKTLRRAVKNSEDSD